MTITTWHVLDIGLLGILSAVLLLWDGDLLTHVPYLQQRDMETALRDVLHAVREGDTVSPAQRRLLQLWLLGLAGICGLILAPFNLWLGVVAGGGLALVALLLPTYFRGAVPERRALAVDDDVLAFLVHLRLRIGEGLVPALEAYVRMYDGVLAEEVGDILQALNTGVPIDDLFVELARKYANPYLRDLATSLRELRERPDPERLLQSFLVQSIKDMRHDRIQSGEQRKAVAAGIGVLCLIPAIFLVALTPPMYTFLQNFG